MIDYDKDGNFISSLRNYYTEKNLPVSVLCRRQKENITGKTVFGVTEVATDLNTEYYVKLQDEKYLSILLSRMPLDNMQPIEKYKKAPDLSAAGQIRTSRTIVLSGRIPSWNIAPIGKFSAAWASAKERFTAVRSLSKDTPSSPGFAESSCTYSRRAGCCIQLNWGGSFFRSYLCATRCWL